VNEPTPICCDDNRLKDVDAMTARARKAVGLWDDDRTSAVLILASGVGPNLAASATVWRSRATIRSLMIRPSEGVRRAGGLVSSHAIGP
jgi:hypothetical protein